MEYVYKYVERGTDHARYVGQTNDLKRRVLAHLKEPMFSNNAWDIYYFTCETLNDAQTLEGHFITLYQTARGDGLNRYKHNWGLSSFAPQNIVWHKYHGEDMTAHELHRFKNYNIEFALTKRVIAKQEELEQLEKDLDALKEAIAYYRIEFEGLGYDIDLSDFYEESEAKK